MTLQESGNRDQGLYRHGGSVFTPKKRKEATRGQSEWIQRRGGELCKITVSILNRFF